MPSFNERHWHLHDDDALRCLDEAAVRLLATSGCHVEHEGLLALLEAAGCRVEKAAMYCYIPERLVRVVSAAASSFGAPGADY